MFDLNEDNRRATREAFGDALLSLCKDKKNVFAVDADLTGSTTTKKLNEEFGDRLINVGIAEQNMIGVASGLSLSGSVVYTGSFAVFGTGRCYEQIRNTVCYSNLDVKICPTHAGVSVGPDGGTHQMLEDVSLMSVLPNMKVFVPCDYNSCFSILLEAQSIKGPIYVRMGRAKLPQIYSSDTKFDLGGSNVLKEGSDVSIFANGVEVYQALKAAYSLEKKGISAEVIDVYSVKPLDRQTIIGSVKKTRRAVVCEEHSIYGGLSSAISTLLCFECPTPLRSISVKDHFGTSGEFEELLVEFGLDANSIEKSVLELID